MYVEWEWWHQEEDSDEQLSYSSMLDFQSRISSKEVPAASPSSSCSMTATMIKCKDNQTKPPFDRLEEVMDIVRLHRLGDDLDLQSVCHLRLSSKAMGKVAARILRTRIQSLEFLISPFTDGCSVLGHSRFLRKSVDQDTIIHFEHGHPVEYLPCEDIPFNTRGNFTYSPTLIAKPIISWSCEELFLANLDRMVTGDIGIREYQGQKLCIFWIPQGPDLDRFTTKVIKVGEIWIEASPKTGRRVCQMMHHSQLELRIQKSRTRQHHDLLVEYQGEMVLDAFHLDLRTLLEVPDTR